MDLSLSKEQDVICETLQSFLQKECPMARVRSTEELGFDPRLWLQLDEMGIARMAAPERLGGEGSSLVDVVLVLEQVGGQLAPIPLVENSTACRLLGRARTALQPLPRALEEVGGIATLALHPARDSVWRVVPAGAIADVVIGIEGDRLIAVTSTPPRSALKNLGSAPLAHRRTDAGCVVELARGAAAQALFQQALDDWRVMTAAALVGLARRAQAIAIEYVKERHQFGVPIGSFQTIAHRLADIATEVDGIELLARKAAWSSDEQTNNIGRLACMALLFAAQTAERVCAESLHFHGGYGFTLEYDIQLLFRRAKAWPLVFGSLADEELELAARIVGPSEEIA